MSFNIEWSAKSWLRVPIEKGAAAGQTSYGNDLVRSIKAGLSTRPRAGTLNAKMKGKGKKRRNGPEVFRDNLTRTSSQGKAADESKNWGIFEPVHGYLGPVVDIVGPVVGANTVIGVLILYIIISWFRQPQVQSRQALGPLRMTPSERMIAYEELWRQEESELWDWLEDRIGIEDLVYPAAREGDDRDAVMKARKEREKVLQARTMEAKLKEDKVGNKQVDDAVRIAEERLEALKRAAQRRKGAEEPLSES